MYKPETNAHFFPNLSDSYFFYYSISPSSVPCFLFLCPSLFNCFFLLSDVSLSLSRQNCYFPPFSINLQLFCPSLTLVSQRHLSTFIFSIFSTSPLLQSLLSFSLLFYYILHAKTSAKDQKGNPSNTN